MRSTRIILLPAAIAAIALPAFITGCKKTPSADTAAPVDRRIILGPENYTLVTQGRIETGPVISGALAPRRSATMRAQIAGAVLASYAEEGQGVGTGALLAQIDDRTIRSQVESAQSALTNARSSLSVASRDQQRQESLLKAGAISERDVDNARRATIAAQASVAQAESQLTAAQKQLAYTRVTAPFSGRISQKLVNTGDIVQSGTAMFTVVDPTSMQLEGSVPASQLAMIHVGDQVEFTVTGYPDRTFTGRITRINPTADPATRQVRVFAEIPNAGNNLVGDLFAEGHVATQAHNALTVPETAIDRKMMRPSVLRVRNGTVERVQIELGLTDSRSDRVEIVSGVAVGDTLLSGAGLQTAVGAKVKLNGAAPTAAAGGGK